MGLIDKNGFGGGAGTCVGIIAGYLMGLTYSINPSLGTTIFLAKYLTTSNKI
jgi:hypothetical protein